MRTFVFAVALVAATSTSVHAQTHEELVRDGNGGSTDHVLTYGMGYHQQRYSPLKDVNKQTVRRLVPVWNLSLNNDVGEQAQPFVYNGVMYATNVKQTVAIDVRHRAAALGNAHRMGSRRRARGVLRAFQSRRRALRRQGFRRVARRAPESARREDRQGALEVEGRRMERRLFDHLGAARRERRGDDRHDRRRVRRARFRRRLRRATRARSSGGAT